MIANMLRKINIKSNTYKVQWRRWFSFFDKFGKSSTVSNEFVTDPDVLVNNLSFSHIREIMVLNDAFERFFYETECMKCNWNVRKLRRQIKTNLYVRAGIIKYT